MSAPTAVKALRPLVFLRPESNSRPHARQLDPQPTELPVRSISSENWRRMAVLRTLCTRTFIPKDPNQKRSYGLLKMLRARGSNSTPPFRPVASSIGTYNYKLAKYLCNLLSPHIPTEHCATDTSTFVQDTQSLSMFGKFMVSFDVESLFTNIPLDECIDQGISCISKGIPYLKLSEPDLRGLITAATAQTLI